MQPTSGGSIPRKHSKTFTGCWTCRLRKIKCDETRPVCLQCLEKRLDCAGYAVRLHWLPPQQTGFDKYPRNLASSSCNKQQRSQIPFGPRRCALNEDQLDQIISSIDGLKVPQSRSAEETFLLHNFGVFDAYRPCSASPANNLTSDHAYPCVNTLDIADLWSVSEQLQSVNEAHYPENSFTFRPDSLNDLESFHYSSEDEAALQLTLDSPGLPREWPECPSLNKTSTFHNPSRTCSEPRNELRVSAQHYRWKEPSGNIVQCPPPAYLSPLEQFLMHHYMHRVVRLFCVIDNMKSPWQKIHLTRALQSIGQMNVVGSTTSMRDALRNALLTISAFVLSNDHMSRKSDDEAARWANQATVLRGKTLKLLKDSVEHGVASETPLAYKDTLATMLSMISINVMSGDTSTCGVHLDGAFHFMKMARKRKAKYSPQARSLHRIYFYLRTIYESTSVRLQEAHNSISSAKLAIPELSQHFSDSGEQSSTEPDSAMSTYECIYGVPQDLLILLGRTTKLIVSIMEARNRTGAPTLPETLFSECDELERVIMEWPLDLKIDVCFGDDARLSSGIVHRTARAFHHALVIYFAQHVRLISHRYLQSHIESVLDCIEGIEKIKADAGCLAAPLYWPAFIAASEAFDERLQARFKKWYEQVEMYRIAAVRTGTGVLAMVWNDSAKNGKRLTSKWRIEVERANINLMLS